MAKTQYARASAFVDPCEDEKLIRLFTRHVAPGRDRIFVITVPRSGVSRIEDFRTKQWLEAIDTGRRAAREIQFGAKVAA